MDRLPPLRYLTTFEAIARLGSMRDAARHLNVSQPAISQTLKALEDHVGADLLDRSRRPARLTELGQRLAEATQSGLGVIEAAIDEIRSDAYADAQQINIACTLGMASFWLMPRLPLFYAQHPDIAVNVSAPPTGLPTLLGGADLALRYGRDDWRDGENIELFPERICPVGHPDLVTRLEQDNTGLETAPLIHVRNAPNTNWAGWSAYFTQRGLRRQNGPERSFDNYVHAVQATQDGLGLMLGWRSITDDLVRNGQLLPWHGGVIDLGTGYFATFSASGAAKPQARIFFDWLMEQCEGH